MKKFFKIFQFFLNFSESKDDVGKSVLNVENREENRKCLVIWLDSGKNPAKSLKNPERKSTKNRKFYQKSHKSSNYK